MCLVQRCVIIQRDENGFGLTVSGDNPVFVQLVKEDGAAMRAGVQTGDRIIKVNGTLVTHSNHIEVVKLIKCEYFLLPLYSTTLIQVPNDSSAQCIVGNPPYLIHPQIIGAEDDYFDSQQEQINGQCSCFQSIDLLKSRPAHLAVFLHHVVSQFDPVPLLCYLYADMHKQTSSKESRRFFMEFHSLFMDRTANLKVSVPETIGAELEKRRLELIPEDLCKQYTQLLQDTLLPDLHKNLEDFRQKRSMGLTLAEDELSKLDVERGKDQQASEKECSCAEHIISKIEDVLLTSQPSEDEKCQTMQYVILTYMKHLGVKVKEPRGLEHKRARINFLPKIKKSIKPEKEGEEKVKKPRFPNILGPPRRLSRVDSTSASSADVQSEDDQGGEVECEDDLPNWQSLVSRGVLASLTPQEIKRQEVINELFYTERAHLRTLKVLDCVFYQRLNRDGILPPDDIKHIFINLEEIIQLHVSITEQMTATRKRSETSVIGQIGDDLLAWFSGKEEEKIKRAVGTFCCNQPSALELIKTKKKKDQRFNLFMQEAESNRLCRRLQLKDIIPVEMQRLTKYPLLLDNIVKYTGWRGKEKGEEGRFICSLFISQQRLKEYQRRLDISSLKQNENPMILELKNLDLTKRKMVHEGPLSWKVNKDKTIELYTILLEDILVLLQKQDERLVLKFHGKNPASAADTKNIFSPIIKLNTVLVRPVATDNKSFFMLSMSENGPQIYELMAQTVSDQRTINPFDGMKSEDEEEELAVADRQEEEEEDEEVDEAELEAFLDGQLADRLPFLQQEGSRRGIAIEDQEHSAFGVTSSKAEDALQTCKSAQIRLDTHIVLVLPASVLKLNSFSF
uniref:Rho guanine nucleotide exchange factor (GEF) 12b n=1 Tax=Echeneis naucrates TaxID=173247 RepID=A0A665U8Y5_ECHNA